MKYKLLFILFLFLTVKLYAGQVQMIPLQVDADSSDFVALFRVKSSVYTEKYLYFQTGVKRLIRYSTEIMGFVEKVIKGKFVLPQNYFFKFSESSRTYTMYDSLGNEIGRSTPLYGSHISFSTLPESRYLFFFNARIGEHDTTYVLKRIESEEKVCILTKQFYLVKDLLKLGAPGNQNKLILTMHV